MESNLQFSSALAEYIVLHLVERKSSLSDSSYQSDVKQLHDFDEYLQSVSFQPEDQIDEALITKWTHLHDDLAAKTIMTYVNSVRMFLRFYSKASGSVVYMPPTYPADDTYVPYLFTDEEMSIIYDFVDNYENGNTNGLPYILLEFPTIVRLLDSSGFRIAEVCSIQMKDINLKYGILKLLNAKGDKQRLVPLSNTMAELLRQYCKAMKLSEGTTAYLFPRHDYFESLKPSDIRNRFKNVLIKSGIREDRLYDNERGPCLHCLRHRFVLKAIRLLLDVGITIEDAIPYLSIYLGHKSIRETEKYIKFVADLFPEEMNKFFKSSEELYPDERIWDDCMF